jgi:MarR family transcriptional regulator, organic hydroperoxide resistance regulator
MKSNNRPKEDERQRVGKQLSFALYGATSRMIRSHRPFLEPLGLTFPQFLVMVTLYEKIPRTVGEIGAELGMDNGTLTPLLKRLVSAGLVTRERDPQDDRRVLINLTATGEALREDVLSVPAKIESACKLSNKDLADLRDTLNHLGLSPNLQPGDKNQITIKGRK